MNNQQIPYPNLFRVQDWGIVTAQFEQRNTLPPEKLIGNVTVAPYVGRDDLAELHLLAKCVKS